MVLSILFVLYSYTCMYTKYNYSHHTHIKTSYSYISMYTKYNYAYKSTISYKTTIKISYSYISMYTKYNYTYKSTSVIRVCYLYCTLIYV